VAGLLESPWLDVTRFPGRRYLVRLAEKRVRQPDDGLTFADLAPHVQRTWAQQLACTPDDLILAASDAEVWRLLLGALLLPGDTVVLAEPAPRAVVSTVLALGARYVDVGRRSDGAIDPAALRLAVAAHPGCVVALESPALFGCDDVQALGAEPLPGVRALLVDASHAPGWGDARLWPTGIAPSVATVVALRDPADLATPVLHAAVSAPGTGLALMVLQGAPRWPPHLMRRAADVLAVVQRPEALAAPERALEQASLAFAAALADRPGVVVYPRAGWRRASECLGGDAVEVADAIRPLVAPVETQGPEPRRTLLWVDLAAAAASGAISPSPAARTPP
jgi:hypothetical protein